MAIGFNAATKYAANSNTVGGSHTAAGSDRAVLIGVFQNTDHTISSLSYGAQSPTLLATVGRLSLYGLLVPNTGAQTATANSDQSDGFVIGIVSYTGVSGFGTPVTASNTELASISAIASSATGDVVIDACAMVNTVMAADGSQTERVSYDEPSPDGHQVGFFAFGMSQKAGAASVTMQWTCSESFGDNVIIAVPLIAAGGGGGGGSTNQKFTLLGVG